jgi:hypothetical protein
VKGEVPGVVYCQGGAFGEIDGQEDFGKRIHDRLSIRIRRSGIAKLAGKALSRRPGSLLASGGFEVEQSLAGQFRNHRVRVAEQPNERADPGEFFGVDTDYGNGVRHRENPSSISSAQSPEISATGKLRFAADKSKCEEVRPRRKSRTGS